MSSWLNPDKRPDFPTQVPFDAATDRKLRLIDLALAVPLLVLLALPVMLSLALGQRRATLCAGLRGQTFRRLQLDFPNTLTGRLCRGLGAANWLVLFNIVRGEMAWVGPRPRPAAPAPERTNALQNLRPGLVCIWTLRQRTAVDFGAEDVADLEYAAQRGVRHDLGLLLRAMMVGLLPAPGEAAQGRVCVGDVSFDNVDMPQALQRIAAMLEGSDAQQVSFVNPACVNIAAHSRGYRRLLGRAALVLPDGIGIKIAADILRAPLKQNVNGTDLFPRLCDMLQTRKASLFLLGGRPEVVERVAAVIRQGWPQLRLAGLRDGYFSTAQEGEVVAQIRASHADVLLVARGVPMQDIFIDRHLHQLGVKAAIGVGGLFDFVSGRINRAPAWMRDTGLEWIYRLLQEPSRMWRRYLVGNFTFLGRIVLQRLGLRRPANDDLRQAAQALGATPKGIAGLRVVLFATGTSASDIPVAPEFPAALLPMGCSSFIERTLEQLSNAGVRQIDLVVSSHPEALRRLLGMGERWGLLLRWHMVKDAVAPYGVLRMLAVDPTERLLIGHADRWVADEMLAGLVQESAILTHTSEALGVVWAGWGDATPALLDKLTVHSDEPALGELMCRTAAAVRVLEADQFVRADSAQALLAAQRMALSPEFLEQVPATWFRTPWGAYSPDALVQAGAQIDGPTLVGPGCMVACDARIGAYTVLTSDAVISAHSSISHSVVLAHTYVGEGLELNQTIVNGRTVQHLSLGVRTVLPASEGLLMDMRHSGISRTSWLARLIALLACLLALPWLAVDTAARRLRGQGLRWQLRPIVVAQDEDNEQLLLINLRCPAAVEAGGQGVLANYGAWADIIQGKRCWFGARPRSQSQWYALSRDWQVLLNNAPVGVLHAPAWSEGDEASAESGAAADVFFAVRQSLPERLRLLAGVVRGVFRRS